MISNVRSGSEVSPTPYTTAREPWWLPAQTGPGDVRAVWVHLDKLFPDDPDLRRQVIIDGLDLDRRARGLLTKWWRGSKGEWFGEVTYAMHFIDGRQSTRLWRDQLVPATALTQRTDGKPLEL